jgi:SnoaL-like domain
MDAELRLLIDRAALHDLMARYAQSVDQRDIPGIVGCFTVDAHVDMDGGAQSVVGRDALASFFEAAFESELMGTGSVSTHLLTDVLVAFDDRADRAHAETLAIACHARPGRSTVSIRGLRYTDDCVRTADGWLIERRTHQSIWQAEATGAPIAPV